MSTAREVGKGVAWGFSTTVVEKILALINIFIVLHYLSVYEYGVVGLVMSAVALVGMILFSGLSTTITADLGVERAKGALGKMKGIFHQYCAFLAVVSLLAFVILFFGATSVASFFGNPSIVLFLQIISFSYLLSPLRIISLLMATVHVRLVDQALYPMLEEVSKTIALLIFFFIFSYGPLGVFLAIITSQAVAILLFSARTISGYQYFSGAVKEEVGKIWHILQQHRKWSIAAGYVGTLTQNVHIWIIKLLLGTEAVGLYSFALGIMSNVAALLPFTDVFASLGPRYEQKRAEFSRLIKNSVRAQFYLSLLVAAGAALALPLFLHLLPKYIPAAELTFLMLVVVIPTATSAIFTPAFSILKQQVSFLYSASIKFMLTVVVLPISIALFGITGIGISSIVVNSISGVERYLRFARTLPGFSLSFRELLTVTTQDKSLIARGLKKMRSPRALLATLIDERPD